MPEREKTGSLLLAKLTPSDSFSLTRLEASGQFSLVLALLFVLPLFGLFLSLCLVLNAHDFSGYRADLHRRSLKMRASWPDSSLFCGTGIRSLRLEAPIRTACSPIVTTGARLFRARKYPPKPASRTSPSSCLAGVVLQLM